MLEVVPQGQRQTAADSPALMVKRGRPWRGCRLAAQAPESIAGITRSRDIASPIRAAETTAACNVASVPGSTTNAITDIPGFVQQPAAHGGRAHRPRAPAISLGRQAPPGTRTSQANTSAASIATLAMAALPGLLALVPGFLVHVDRSVPARNT
jgi:hypothetical protein